MKICKRGTLSANFFTRSDNFSASRWFPGPGNPSPGDSKASAKTARGPSRNSVGSGCSATWYHQANQITMSKLSKAPPTTSPPPTKTHNHSRRASLQGITRKTSMQPTTNTNNPLAKRRHPSQNKIQELESSRMLHRLRTDGKGWKSERTTASEESVRRQRKSDIAACHSTPSSFPSPSLSLSCLLLSARQLIPPATP